MPVISKSNPVNWGHPLNKGRVAWWKCLSAEGTGTVWRDIAGGNHANLVYGSPFIQGAKPVSARGSPGKLGAMQFDRSDDVGLVANHPRFAIASQITLAASFLTTTTGQYQHIILKAGGVTWSAPYAVWCMRISNTDLIQTWLNDGNTYPANYCISPSTVSLNKWYRCHMTYDGATIRLYLDGAQVATTSLAVSITTTTYPVYLGANTVNNELFGGLLDDVTVYNRALSANEVAQDYAISRLGYPGVLNRLKPTAYFFLSSGLAANPVRGGGAASNPLWGYLA